MHPIRYVYVLSTRAGEGEGEGEGERYEYNKNVFICRRYGFRENERWSISNR